eukprot:3545327-Rhodomonas_salina.2
MSVTSPPAQKPCTARLRDAGPWHSVDSASSSYCLSDTVTVHGQCVPWRASSRLALSIMR